MLLRSLNAKRVGLHNWRSNACQTSGCWWKSLSLRASGLWSQVVALALTRCVFYCFLIIARLLSGSLYCSRQAAWLLNAYEAYTSFASAAVAECGGEEGVRVAALCGSQPSTFMHVRETRERGFLVEVYETHHRGTLFSAFFNLMCWAEQIRHSRGLIQICCKAKSVTH